MRSGVRLWLAGLALVLLGWPVGAEAQQVQLVSKAVPPSDAAGVENGPVSMSSDGKLVVYVSRARNLVPGQVDRDGTLDVFLFDGSSNSVTLVSHAASSLTTGGDSDSYDASISADGAYVVFTSWASNLVAGQVDGTSTSDVFLWERTSGTITLVSHAFAASNQAGSSHSFAASLSGDGSYVAFQSAASNLVAGGSDLNGTEDVLLWERATNSTAFVSHVAGTATTTANGFSSDPEISDDSRFVAFRSFAMNLVPGTVDTNLQSDVYLYERATTNLTLVSHVPGSTTTTGNNRAASPSLSGDGAWIAFESGATNLVAGQIDVNGTRPDIFLYETATGLVSLVSHTAASSTNTGSAASLAPAISLDGAVVAFRSAAVDLVSGQVDGNGVEDAFWYERGSGQLFLASHSSSSSVTAGDGVCDEVALSPDGAWIAFRSAATDIVVGQTEANTISDVFLVDRATAAATLVSRNSASATTTGVALQPASGLAVRAAGGDQRVGYISGAWDLVAGVADHSGDTVLNVDAFLFEATSKLNTLASPTAATMFSATAGGTSVLGSGPGYRTASSSDGRYLAFVSNATNLVPGQVDVNGTDDVFLYDRQTGTVVLVSHAFGQPATAANGASSAPTLSTDGRSVAFQSEATNLVNGQTDFNGGLDVFLFDAGSGNLTLVSENFIAANVTGNFASTTPVISGDGGWIAFLSRATDLLAVTDGNGADDVMLFNRGSGTVSLVSHIPGAPTTAGNGGCDSPSINDPPPLVGPVRVAFRSTATNLVAGQSDVAGTPDVFLYTVAPESMVLVTAVAPSTTTAAGGALSAPKVSADANWVAYSSTATNLVGGQIDSNGVSDVFLFRSGGTNVLVSHAVGSTVTSANGASGNPSISQNGGFVAYESLATDLVSGVSDANGASDVFVYDGVGLASQLASHRAGAPLVTASGPSKAPAIDGNGNTVVFLSLAGDLVPGQTGPGSLNGVFWFQRPSGLVLLASPALNTSLRRGEGNGQSPIIARGGAFAFYASDASDLVAQDYNQTADVFQFQPLLADLRVTKDDGAATATPGTAISYTITVTNNGPTTVSEVALLDTLPPELLTPAFTPSAGSYNALSGLWTFPPLAPPGSLTMTLLATVDPAATGTLTNTVTVSGRGIADPQLADNTAMDTDTLSPSADLVVLKSDSADPVPTGGNLVYTIIVRNDGPSTATGVTLTDTLPAGVSFLSVTPGSPTCSHSAGTVSCAFAAVAPGAGGIRTVTVEVLAPASTGPITNAATVSSATSDPGLLNNTVNESTLVTLATDTIQFFTVTSTDQQNVLEWRTPMTGLETVIRYNKAATGTSACAEPTATVGMLLTAPVFAPNANQFLVHNTPALENDTTYCYGIFVKTGASPDTFSAGRFARGRPFVTGTVKWAFSTGATAVAPPTVATTAAFVVSNDRALYAIQRGPGGGRWLVGPGPYVPFRMTQPAQARSPWVPTTSVPGATQVVFVGSQNGTVYAIDAVSGGGAAGTPRWQSPTLTGGVVLAAPAGIFQEFGATLDRVLVGSWNSSGPSQFASLRTTDGGVQNSFNDPNLGIVSGMAAVAYPDRVYFTSHTFGGGTRSLWCLTLTPAFGPCAAWSGVPAGEVETSPVLRGGRIYLGDTSGVVRAFLETDGSQEWSFPTLDGGVKGFVFPDRASGDLFLSTTNKVWGFNHVSGAGTKRWEATLTGGALPSIALYAPGTKRVYVGGSDGYLYELDFTLATLSTPPSEKRIKLGDGMALVGAPSLDRGFDLIYVGSVAGVIYAVSIPLP